MMELIATDEISSPSRKETSSHADLFNQLYRDIWKDKSATYYIQPRAYKLVIDSRTRTEQIIDEDVDERTALSVHG